MAPRPRVRSSRSPGRAAWTRGASSGCARSASRRTASACPSSRATRKERSAPSSRARPKNRRQARDAGHRPGRRGVPRRGRNRAPARPRGRPRGVGLPRARARRPQPRAPPTLPIQPKRDLVWVGLVGLIDPPRAGVREAIGALREAGIRTVMVTGDQKGTAMAVAHELGIAQPGDLCLDSKELATYAASGGGKTSATPRSSRA